MLIAPRTDYPPVGALYVADALEQAGYDVHLFKSDVEHCEFLSTLLELDPLFVGFSVHTYPSLVEMISLSKLAHNLGYKVVWGGNHPTCLHDECLKQDYIDYVVVEEAETQVVYLAQAIANNAPWRDILKFSTDLDRYKPAWHLVKLDNYLYPAAHSVRGGGDGAARIFYYLMTSRGCPYSCAFCYNSRTPKQPWRAHSAAWVTDQVAYLKRELDIDGVGFWDDFFLGDRKRAVAIIAYLKAQGIKFLCEARASDLDGHFVRWLKEMGCLQLFIGAESGSNRVLGMIDKRITADDILHAAELTRKHGLPARFSFIYGFPGEDFDEIMQTKALVETLRSYPNVSISGPKLYTPYPGTALYRSAIEHGFKPPDDMSGWAGVNRSSDLEYLPWLKRELERNGRELEDLFDG
jgi:anaerobic magnesium-protoporphyrin IX monomethyl ester cyclase